LYDNRLIKREGYAMKKDMRPSEVIMEERRKCAVIYTKRMVEKKKIAKYKRVIAEYEARQESYNGVKPTAKHEAGIV
jgi:putative heme iron utilization protein